MTTMEIDGTTASLVESIRFTRTPGTCEWRGHHDRWEITWGEGRDDQRAHVYWCDHPVCDLGETRWRLLDSPPEVKLTQWIPPGGLVAVAYLLLVFPRDALPRMEARIGICDQWQDRQFGNYGSDAERRLFTERYFAESGPGVYPATIVDLT